MHESNAVPLKTQIYEVQALPLSSPAPAKSKKYLCDSNSYRAGTEHQIDRAPYWECQITKNKSSNFVGDPQLEEGMVRLIYIKLG